MSAMFLSVMRAIGRWRERHETVMRLQRLDDRVLRDIGIMDRRDVAITVDRAGRGASVGPGRCTTPVLTVRNGVRVSRGQCT